MVSAKFASLREQLTQGRVLLPGDEGFDGSLERWSKTCVKPAAAVAQPKTAEEVSAVIKFAAANGIAFNVKGGGHSTSQVSSAPSPEGMVLDLGLMREVSVNAEAQTVQIGGGCVWKDVDEALWAHGLATPGGAVSHTGVGGLILHGGFGVLSGLHGLTIDLLISCQVVLADGSIVTASETENSDLFWALKGAGSSFGVVTQFTTRAFPQGNIWGGLIIFMLDKLPALVEFYNKWGETTSGKEVMLLGMGYAPPAPGSAPGAPRPPVLIVQVIHVGKDAEKLGPEFFAPVLELESLMQQIGVMPYPAVNQGADDTVFPSGRNYLFGGANFTLPMKLSTAELIRDKFYGFAQKHPEAGMENSVCMLEGIPNQKIRGVPLESAAFNSRGNYYNILLAWSWTNEGVFTQLREYNREVQKEIRSQGYDDVSLQDGVGQYINYSGPDGLKAEAAFGSHTSRLRDLKAKYDPSNVFDKLWKLVGKAEEQWAPTAPVA